MWFELLAVKNDKVKDNWKWKLNRSGSARDHYRSNSSSNRERYFKSEMVKRFSKERNLYPGYVFIEANLVGEIPHMIKNMTNVIGFLV